MLSITVKTDLPQTLLQAADDIDQQMAGLLQEIGTQLLSLQKQDFEKKSRGGTGVDGTTWKPLSPMTEYLKATRSISRGSRTAGERSGTVSKEERARLVAKRRKLRQKLLGTVGPFVAGSKKAKAATIQKSQIGVDTGLLRNCVKPGFSGSHKRTGIPGANILQVDGNRVVIGYGVEYADYFDDVRPLMPNTLPEPWEKSIEDIMDKWAADIMRKVN